MVREKARLFCTRVVELGEAGANVEGIEEGVNAIAESMGKHIATAIKSLFNN